MTLDQGKAQVIVEVLCSIFEFELIQVTLFLKEEGKRRDSLIWPQGNLSRAPGKFHVPIETVCAILLFGLFWFKMNYDFHFFLKKNRSRDEFFLATTSLEERINSWELLQQEQCSTNQPSWKELMYDKDFCIALTLTLSSLLQLKRKRASRYIKTKLIPKNKPALIQAGSSRKRQNQRSRASQSNQKST